MRRGQVADLPFIGQPQELSREDLERLKGDRGRIDLPQRLRDSHHRVARLAATGMKTSEIAQRTGYSANRISSLLQSPAMQELIARFRDKINEAFIASQDEYYELATANMLAAERHIRDKIDELDEAGELLPVNIALKISRDAADRFGYGKHQTNTNVNMDFAKMLESAIARSKRARDPRVIEGEPVGAGDETRSAIEASSLPSPAPALAEDTAPQLPAPRQAVGPTAFRAVGPIRRRA